MKKGKAVLYSGVLVFVALFLAFLLANPSQGSSGSIGSSTTILEGGGESSGTTTAFDQSQSSASFDHDLFAVPEIPMGTLSVSGAVFAALVVFTLAKRHSH